MSDLGDLARDTNYCGRCGVEPGEWCVTDTGGRARYSHSARTRPVYTAWSAGFEVGARDALRNAEWVRRVFGEVTP